MINKISYRTKLTQDNLEPRVFIYNRFAGWLYFIQGIYKSNAKSLKMLKAKIILLLICYLIFNCNAITKDQLYPFGIQDDHLRQDSDDVSSPEVQLSIPIVFYENIYKSIFVSIAFIWL